MKKEDERGLSKWIWECPLYVEFWVKDGEEYEVKYARSPSRLKKVKESKHQIYFDQTQGTKRAVIAYDEKHTNPEELGFTIIKKPCGAKAKKALRKFLSLRHGRNHMRRVHNVRGMDTPCVKV